MPADQVTQDTADEVREAVANSGVDNASSPVVTTSSREGIIVQTEPLTSDESAEIAQVLLDTTGASPDDLSQSEIGASWGQEVAERALLGLAVFLVLVVLFIWAYFREWKMSVAALVALAHDVVITIGVYAISGFEVTPATVTGILTILGFSLYDTVVVFDKVRENTKNLRESRTTYAKAANLAVNQTLVRSINTSIVALIPVGCILYAGAVMLGSGSMKDLALALFVGMAAGVYSSVFIATPLLVHLKSRESDVVQAEKRDRARQRAQVDRYASVPAFTEDLPLQDEPGAAGADRPVSGDEPAPSAAAARAGGHGPRAGRPAAAQRGPRQQGVRPAAAESSAPLQAGQEVTEAGSRTESARAALERLIIDVPDFPEPGIVFKDITPLLADHASFTAVVDALAAVGRDEAGAVVVDKVVGMEARGFILAAPVALALGAGFVPVRKAGKLPRETHAVSYALEYGEASLEMHRDAVAEGDRVLLVDDVLATGGTVKATCELVERSGGTVTGVAVLMELGFLAGREAVGDVPITTLLTI